MSIRGKGSLLDRSSTISYDTGSVSGTSDVDFFHSSSFGRIMNSIFLAFGAFLGALGVVTGAFGAHLLEESLSREKMEVFETGVLYHLIHAVALILVAQVTAEMPSWLSKGAGMAFIAGILLFSGSLYALALTDISSFGMVAPVGGTLLIVGWCLLAATPLMT